MNTPERKPLMVAIKEVQLLSIDKPKLYLNGLRVTHSEFKKILKRTFSTSQLFDKSCTILVVTRTATFDEPEKVTFISIKITG